MKKKVFRLSGLHCSSCNMLVEGELEDIGANAKCDYVNSKVEVEWDSKRLDEGRIVEAIEAQGYKVVGKG